MTRFIVILKYVFLLINYLSKSSITDIRSHKSTFQDLLAIKVLNTEKILVNEFDNRQEIFFRSPAWSLSRLHELSVCLVYNAILVAFSFILKDTTVNYIRLIIEQMTVLVKLILKYVRQTVKVKNLISILVGRIIE